MNGFRISTSRRLMRGFQIPSFSVEATPRCTLKAQTRTIKQVRADRTQISITCMKDVSTAVQCLELHTRHKVFQTDGAALGHRALLFGIGSSRLHLRPFFVRNKGLWWRRSFDEDGLWVAVTDRARAVTRHLNRRQLDARHFEVGSIGRCGRRAVRNGEGSVSVDSGGKR